MTAVTQAWVPNLYYLGLSRGSGAFFSFDTLPFRRSFPFLSRRAGSRFSSGRFPFPAGGSGGGGTAGGPGGSGPAESPDQSRDLIDGSLDGCTDAYVFNCPR